MTRAPLLCLLPAILALAAVPASAQMYRYVTPDGRVVFGDSVPAGARKVESIAPADTVTPEQSAEAQRRLQQEKAEAAQGDARQERFDASYDALKAAEQNLEAARQRQKDGEEPLPGERVGNVGGTSRLRESYFQRQEQLKADVQRAERKVEALRSQTRSLE
ncbi:DUF4124 domain-containing protein [Oryzomicrobium sp.]|uniref:DUF4124 domain-containing protein n=1 Tax=Oryzomicrobium sp. TaxID=1911578 RepID=UPI0025E32667|nr:DUF4124 domain-containing protein [Oryzomicrobium sp.]MCE1242308.1 DUF4124 domain-containing protein [Oryzomicrobium sp.]